MTERSVTHAWPPSPQLALPSNFASTDAPLRSECCSFLIVSSSSPALQQHHRSGRPTPWWTSSEFLTDPGVANSVDLVQCYLTLIGAREVNPPARSYYLFAGRLELMCRFDEADRHADEVHLRQALGVDRELGTLIFRPAGMCRLGQNFCL